MKLLALRIAFLCLGLLKKRRRPMPKESFWTPYERSKIDPYSSY